MGIFVSMLRVPRLGWRRQAEWENECVQRTHLALIHSKGDLPCLPAQVVGGFAPYAANVGISLGHLPRYWGPVLGPQSRHREETLRAGLKEPWLPAC